MTALLSLALALTYFTVLGGIALGCDRLALAIDRLLTRGDDQR